MKAYYNEIDPKAAAWLRELIKQGHIAPGDVDERSIVDVRASDLDGYTQCHFFAGIGVWSLALRQAGWPDDREVWTGSCPCQPFSTAGKGEGIEDERHLFPELKRLIAERKPDVVFGEQVASKAGMSWLDNVQFELEAERYTCGAVTFPACSVGSPHQRQRNYWVANSQMPECELSCGTWAGRQGLADNGGTGELANTASDRRRGQGQGTEVKEGRAPRSEPTGQLPNGLERRSIIGGPAPTNGLWKDVDWLYCRDGKWRPVEPGTFPLAHGAAERVGLLRGYGNAIVKDQAQAFIEVAMEILQ